MQLKRFRDVAADFAMFDGSRPVMLSKFLNDIRNTFYIAQVSKDMAWSFLVIYCQRKPAVYARPTFQRMSG